ARSRSGRFGQRLADPSRVQRNQLAPRSGRRAALQRRVRSGDGAGMSSTVWRGRRRRQVVCAKCVTTSLISRGGRENRHTNADSSSLQVSGLSVMGDYYFTRALGSARDAGGFRATSGVLVGSRSTSLLSTLPTAGLAGRAFSVGRSIGGLGLVGTDLASPSD